MFAEIVITAIIIGAAIFILYNNLRKKSLGKCDCGNCSSSCPYYTSEHKKIG